jgi:uncharacterized membrane protein
MEANSLLAHAKDKKNFSKYDPSGTDPNRYASVSNPKEADNYLHKGKKSIIPGLRVNVSKTERILMIAAGSYLLYRALKKKDDKKVMEGITAGTMLFRGISGYCPAYDVIDRTKVLKSGEAVINTSLTVNKPVNEVYNAWRKLENLPLFMDHLKSVEQLDEYTSEWKAKVPGGLGTVSWKAEILMDEPNELLSWHSLPNSTVRNAGKVRFKDNGNSTEIDVTISYHAPMGKAGEAVAKLFNPAFEKIVKSDIKDFKHYIEETKAPMP